MQENVLETAEHAGGYYRIGGCRRGLFHRYFCWGGGVIVAWIVYNSKW